MQVALLDIDGTLADTVPVHEAAIASALSDFNFVCCPPELRGLKTDEKLRRLHFPFDKYNELKALKQLRFVELLSSSAVRTNTSLYYELVREGYKVIFCTQSNAASAQAVLQFLGIWDKSSVLFAGLDKYNPQTLLGVVAELGVRIEDVVLFDDNPKVWQAARSVGIKVVEVVL